MMNILISSFLSIVFIISISDDKVMANNFINLPEKIVTKQDGISDNFKSNLNVTFETDERLFTFLSWMNWIADIDKRDEALTKFPEYIELREYLNKLPKTDYQKHRLAYEKYLPNASLYTKNGLLVSDSQYYGSPPNFKLNPLKTGDKYEQYRFSQLPDADLISEFYQFAKINELWKTKYQKAHQEIMNKYKEDSLKILSNTLFFLKVKQIYPVSIRFNIIGNFGINGQTSFIEDEKKFIIKLNPKVPKVGHEKFEYTSMLQTIRHEFSHSILNSAVTKNKTIIENSLKKVQTTLKLRNIPPEEMVAQCIGYIDIDDFLKENVFYYNDNILFMHFLEKLPEFEKSGKSFIDFLPELFKSFDPDKEIKRWHEIDKKIKEES